ncbi:MAG: hypothetical protein H0U73_11525 [Tatlockia sp.]|nr:hypothetical protein [Tatlockia sp.]
MKKLTLIIACFVPVLSFAGNAYNSNLLDAYQEQCAKEKDPVKRQNYCHRLDQHSRSQSYIPDSNKETITV